MTDVLLQIQYLKNWILSQRVRNEIGLRMYDQWSINIYLSIWKMSIIIAKYILLRLLFVIEIMIFCWPFIVFHKHRLCAFNFVPNCFNLMQSKHNAKKTILRSNKYWMLTQSVISLTLLGIQLQTNDLTNNYWWEHKWLIITFILNLNSFIEIFQNKEKHCILIVFNGGINQALVFWTCPLIWLIHWICCLFLLPFYLHLHG